MRVKDLIDIPCGFRFIFNNLELSSPLSRSLLLEQHFIKEINEIEHGYRELEEAISLFGTNGKGKKLIPALQLELSKLKGVAPSIEFIANGGVADDIVLFEIKELALLTQKVSKLVKPLSLSSVKLPNLEEVVAILDPEGAAINSFYIYDSYSPELKQIRAQIRSNKEFDQELLVQQERVENSIREQLSLKLQSTTSNLLEALRSLAKLDTLIAKSLQMESMDLIIPKVGNGTTSYQALFNPELKESLKIREKEYQKVDIEISTHSPTLIIGSNMGGKSVTLKSLALSQILFQLNFGVPAQQAEISVVEEILYSLEQREDWSRGLSTFGAEIGHLNQILGRAKEGGRVLILLDEPAATTNPIEGSALVSSLLAQLANRDLFCVVTTHYRVEGKECNKLKVRGLVDTKMDYSLLQYGSEPLPYEALKVAKMLNVDSEWLKEAERELKKIIKDEE